MMEPTTSVSPTTNLNDRSLFSLKYKITDVKSDPARWNKDWEKLLRTLSPSKDVYPVVSSWWIAKKDNGSSGFTVMGQRATEELCMVQEAFQVANQWDNRDKQNLEYFSAAWMLFRYSWDDSRKLCVRFCLEVYK